MNVFLPRTVVDTWIEVTHKKKNTPRFLLLLFCELFFRDVEQRRPTPTKQLRSFPDPPLHDPHLHRRSVYPWPYIDVHAGVPSHISDALAGACPVIPAQKLLASVSPNAAFTRSSLRSYILPLHVPLTPPLLLLKKLTLFKDPWALFSSERCISSKITQTENMPHFIIHNIIIGEEE